MPVWTLAFLFGVFSLSFFKHLPSIQWSYGLLPAALLITAIVSKRYAFFVRPLLAILLGFAWILLHAHHQLNAVLPLPLEGKTVTVIGTVSSLPEERGDHNVRFIFDVKTLSYNQQQFSMPKRILLSWYGSPENFYVGDQWQLIVRLKQPRSTFNPAAFDYEGWLFEHQINAVGYVVNHSNNSPLLSNKFYAPIDRLRQTLDKNITKTLQGKNLEGLIAALVVGSRVNITTAQWQVLQGTGTNHLMAIAGLHIGFVAGFAFWLVNILWRRCAWLTLRIPSPQAAAVAALLAALSYSALAGFALPTQRAVIMITIFLITILFRKNLPLWRAWCLALLAILIFDPLAVISDSFWLSFGAVATILYGVSARLKPHGWWWKWGRTQGVIGLGLVPLTLLFFHQVSLAGFVANAIAIPWVGFVVLPLSLSGSLLLLILPAAGEILLNFAEHALALLWPLLQWFAAQNALQWREYIVDPVVLITAMIGIFLLLMPRGMPGRWLSAIWLFPLLLWIPPGPATGQWWFTLLDVGQGLSAVVRTAHHVLVYDTGVKFSDHFDMGQAVVVPFLQSARVQHIDVMIISHGDNDHIGGANSILKQMQVSKVITSVPERFSPDIAIRCIAGQQWQWDGVQFEILYPPLGQEDLDNDNSCVLRVTQGKTHILFTGDIERFSEKFLLKNLSQKLTSDILIVPHHGSRTSSTEDFISAIHPQIALFPTGYRNRYHFPHPTVVARYLDHHATLYNTATAGAITFKLNNNENFFTPLLARKTDGHYWNFVPE